MNWDDALTQEQREHFLKWISKCKFHNAISDADAYKVVLDENQSKNRAIGLLVLTYPRLFERENEVQWHFNPDRSVTISHPDITQLEKDAFNLLPKTDIVKKVNLE